jgi:hypothetical protein
VKTGEVGAYNKNGSNKSKLERFLCTHITESRKQEVPD